MAARPACRPAVSSPPLDRCDQMLHHQALHRFVTREGIVVVAGKEDEVVNGRIGIDRDRCGEAAVDRQHRRRGESGEA